MPQRLWPSWPNERVQLGALRVRGPVGLVGRARRRQVTRAGACGRDSRLIYHRAGWAGASRVSRRPATSRRCRPNIDSRAARCRNRPAANLARRANRNLIPRPARSRAPSANAPAMQTRPARTQWRPSNKRLGGFAPRRHATDLAGNARRRLLGPIACHRRPRGSRSRPSGRREPSRRGALMAAS